MKKYMTKKRSALLQHLSDYQWHSVDGEALRNAEALQQMGYKLEIYHKQVRLKSTPKEDALIMGMLRARDVARRFADDVGCLPSNVGRLLALENDLYNAFRAFIINQYNNKP